MNSSQSGRNTGEDAFIGIGILILWAAGFPVLLFALITTFIVTRWRVRARWLFIIGGVITVGTAAFGYAKGYALSLLSFWHDVAQMVMHHTVDGSMIMHSVIEMLPLSVGLGLLGGGVGSWLLRRRRHLLGLPIQDPEEVVPKPASLRALAKLKDPEDGAVLGLDERKKPIVVTDKEMNQHAFLVGASGAGKSNTIQVILKSAIRRGHPVILVDGKGDIEFAQAIQQIAELHGRECRVFGLGQRAHYNPFRHGDPTELTDKLIEACGPWSEAHYRDVATAYVQRVFSFLRELEATADLRRVVQLLNPDQLAELARRAGVSQADMLSQYAEDLTKSQREGLHGLAERLAVLDESDFGSLLLEDTESSMIDLADAVRKGQVVIMSLPGLSHSGFVPRLGKLIVQDLQTVAARIASEGGAKKYGYTYVVLDEFNLFAGQNVVPMFNKTRFAGFCTLAATQELSDLTVENEAVLNQVMGSTNVRIVHRLDVPESAEYVAGLIGTRTTYQKTLQTEEAMLGSRPTRMGTVRDVETFVVHPNLIKGLGTGQAVVIRKVPNRLVATVQVRVAGFVKPKGFLKRKGKEERNQLAGDSEVAATLESAEILAPPPIISEADERRGLKLHVGRVGIIRVFVWVVLGILLARGVYSVIRPTETPTVVPTTNAKPAVSEVNTTQGAAEFAKLFATKWLSFDINGAKAYLASGYTLPQNALQVPSGYTQQILSADVWNVRAPSKNQLNVVIRADVKPAQTVAQTIKQGNKSVTKTVQKNLPNTVVYLNVPLVVQGDHYGVTGEPTYVPAPSTATMPNNTTPTPADVATTGAVRTVLDAFFRAYAGGNPSDLALVFADGKPRATLSGAKYQGIKQLSVAQPSGNQTSATATVKLSVDGVTTLQSYQFELEQAANRWLIQSVDPSISTTH